MAAEEIYVVIEKFYATADRIYLAAEKFYPPTDILDTNVEVQSSNGGVQNIGKNIEYRSE